EAGDVGNQVGLDVPGLGGDGPVVRQGDVGEGDVGARVEEAPAHGDRAGGAQRRDVGGQAVGDGQVADLHVGRAAADVEDPGGAAAADRQTVGARAVDRQAARDAQLAACRVERDGAAHAPRESDGVSAGGCVGLADRGSERAGAAVV